MAGYVRVSVPEAGRRAGRTGSSRTRGAGWILVVIGIAQLMVVLDLTVMNLALPSAQHALHFNNVDRQWIVTAYALSFGSLLLFCGRLADLFGRKVMFITGLAGFAVASAIGGASVNFTMLVTARACQGVFAAMLAPGGAVAADHDLQRLEGAGQGLRDLRHDRGRGRRGRAAAWRRADLVPVLALVPVHQPGLRRCGDRRWRHLAAPATADIGRQARHPRRPAGLRRSVLPGLRVLQRRHARLVHPVDVWIPGGRRAAARRLRGVAGPRRASAAAAPGGA